MSADEGENEAQTYLWRRCCLEKIQRSLARDGFGRTRGKVSLYAQGFLRDVASLTVETPVAGYLRQGGLYYLQWYNSIKEVADAQKCFPFQHERLCELAVDDELWKADLRSDRGASSGTRAALMESYLHGKRRLREAYASARQTSYGARFEGRFDLDCLDLMVERGVAYESRRRHDRRRRRELERAPQAMWAVTTESYARFMLGNYDKFTMAFEVVRLTSRRSAISLARTKVLTCLLTCLRAFANTAMERDALLWYDDRTWENGTVRKRGLGFETTVQTYGYGWLLPVIDWEGLVLESEVDRHFVDIDHRVLSWYAHAKRQRRELNELLQSYAERLQETGSPKVELDIFQTMAHLCFRQFRGDVIKKVAEAGELRSTVAANLDTEALYFCYEGLCAVMVDEPNLVSGNKTLIKHPVDMVEWLWGSSDVGGYNRKHFKDLPYRTMYNQTTRAIDVRVGVKQRWEDHFRCEFIRSHWLLPYPDINGTLLSTAKTTRRRQWWGVSRKRDAIPSDPMPWVWARGAPERGYPPSYPALMDEVEQE